MVALFVVVMMILDAMIVGVLFVRSIKGIVASKSTSAKLFWAIMTFITVAYVLILYKVAVVEFFDSGISILFYPPVITFFYWLISKFKQR